MSEIYRVTDKRDGKTQEYATSEEAKAAMRDLYSQGAAKDDVEHKIIDAPVKKTRKPRSDKGQHRAQKAQAQKKPRSRGTYFICGVPSVSRYLTREELEAQLDRGYADGASPFGTDELIVIQGYEFKPERQVKFTLKRV